MGFYGFYKFLFHLILQMTIRFYLTKKNKNNYIAQENLADHTYLIKVLQNYIALGHAEKSLKACTFAICFFSTKKTL